MPTILRIEAGPRAGVRIPLQPGQSVEIGRRGLGFAVPEDFAMSAAHFVVESDETGRVVFRDLNSRNGTAWNGTRAASGVLADGDCIAAGRSVFRFSADAGAEDYAGRFTAVDGEPLETLRGFDEPLYAILDAARSPRILELLRDSAERHECLYEGASAETLADCAPYLALVPPDSLLLEDLVAEGWGNSWGIWATSAAEFGDVLRHWRQFLLVAREGGRKVYFRFYDPRVLRSFVPDWDRRQLSEFTGPMGRILVEDASGLRLLSVRGPRLQAAGNHSSAG